MGAVTAGVVLAERFEVVGELGRGGSATVWLARDRVRGEDVALKILHPHLADDPATVGRLRREVATAARLDHPGVLAPHDLHAVDDLLVLVLPLHRGTTLADHVQRHGPWTADALGRLARRLAGVLEHAHRHGVVHRDVTPTNVLVDDDGSAVLTDFGLARVDQRHTATTTTVMGTPGYVAPEVHEGLSADPRSDLYGLGAVLYLAATGGPPFAGPTPVAMLRRQLDGAHPPLREARSDLPRAFTATVDALLAPDPDDRPQTAGEVVDLLEGRGEGAARPETPTVGEPHLPPGPFQVVVRRARHGPRRGWRHWGPVRAAQSAALVAAQRVRDAGDLHLATQIEDFVGISPERRLTIAVARAARLPDDALVIPQAVREYRFRLVERVDEATADQLALDARRAGFRARVEATTPSRSGATDRMRQLVGTGIALVVIGLLVASVVRDGGVAMPFFLIGGVAFFQLGDRPSTRLPLAFGHDLRPLLRPEHQHRLLAPPTTSATATPERAPRPAPTPRPTLAERIRERLATTRRALDAADLPSAIADDLRAALAETHAEATRLAAQLTSTEAALADVRPDPVQAEALRRVRAQLVRLDTLARAGEPTDPAELARLRARLGDARDASAHAEALDRRRIQLTARLLELDATVREVRRELAGAGTTQPLTEVVARLRSQRRAAQAALAEVDAVAPPARRPVRLVEAARR